MIAEILAGLQRRCRSDGVKTKEAELRAVCDDLRRQRAASLSGYVLDPGRSMEFKGTVNSLPAHARRALATPETEIAGDVWYLTGRSQDLRGRLPVGKDVRKRPALVLSRSNRVLTLRRILLGTADSPLT